MKSLVSHGWVLLLGCLLAALGLARTPQGGGGSSGQGTGTRILPSLPAAANADSNNRMVAVTGTDVTGASILYLVDTVGLHLAVYQASGGGGSTRGVELMGVRNIGLDFELDGFNDQTRHEGRPFRYKDLREMFLKEGLLEAGSSGAGSTGPGGG